MPLLEHYPVFSVQFRGETTPQQLNIIGGEDEIRRNSCHFFSDTHGNIIFAEVKSLNRQLTGPPLIHCELRWTTYTAVDALEVLGMIRDLLEEPNEMHPYPGFMYPPQVQMRAEPRQFIEDAREPTQRELVTGLGEWLETGPHPIRVPVLTRRDEATLEEVTEEWRNADLLVQGDQEELGPLEEYEATEAAELLDPGQVTFQFDRDELFERIRAAPAGQIVVNRVEVAMDTDEQAALDRGEVVLAMDWQPTPPDPLTAQEVADHVINT